MEDLYYYGKYLLTRLPHDVRTAGRCPSRGVLSPRRPDMGSAPSHRSPCSVARGACPAGACSRPQGRHQSVERLYRGSHVMTVSRRADRFS
jgi:hypothetical protein